MVFLLYLYIVDTYNIKLSQLKDICKISYRSKSGGEYYQRESNSGSIKKIKKFVLNLYNTSDTSKVILFPTPIIIALDPSYGLDIEELDNNVDFDSINSKLYIQKIFENSKIFEINISTDLKELFLIVDGQHRFLALKEIIEINNTFDIELNVMILIDYTIYEKAKVFTNVKENQKSVNKSLVYDIFGTLTEQEPDIYRICYLLIKQLHNTVLDGQIKFLAKGSGVISQAFMTETFKEILEKSNHGLYSDIYKDYNGIKDLIEYIEKNIFGLEEYFKFIKNKYFPYWPKPKREYLKIKKDELTLNCNTIQHDSEEYYKILKKIKTLNKEIDKIDNNFYTGYFYKDILLKTTGMYALLKISDFLFSKERYIIAIRNKESIQSLLIDDFKNIDGKEFFSKDSLYSKGTGKGQQNTLYCDLLKNIQKKDFIS